MKKSIKRIFTVVLAVAICLVIMPMTLAAGVRGDVNRDGSVNASDALMILRKSVGYNDDGFDAYRADLDNNGKVNASDALRVLQIAVGSDDPTGYSKNEAIKFYSDALDSVAYSKVSVLYQTKYVSTMVNDDDPTDFVKFDEQDEMVDDFENGYDEAEYSFYDFCPNARINPDLVKSAKITKQDASTYVVKIVLVEDEADDEDYVPHKIYPYLLNYADCTVDRFEDYFVNDATAKFPASEITAVVKDGCIQKVTFDIPFEMNMSFEHYEYYEYLNVTETGTVTDVYTFTQM